MIKIFIIIFSIYFAPSVFSAESAPCGDYGECDDYSYDLYNNESLQKGLATYNKLLLWLSLAKILSLGKDSS